MKIGFFGTPELAKEVLEYLCSHHTVLFAVSSHDKAQGRSRKVCKTPVKACAEEHCVDVLQPLNLKCDEVVEELQKYNADIFVVFAYGHIIPKSVFTMPPLGTINMHPSLLPLYRGAAPVQWAIIDGQEKTGVTIQKIDEELDAGDIICQEEVAIPPDMTSCDLYEKVIPVGIQLIEKAMNGLREGTLKPQPQNHEAATYCGKINRETAKINWGKNARTIHNLVRGMNPKPTAWTTFRGHELKIWKTTVPEEHNLPELFPGEIVRYGKHRLLAGTGRGVIEILELQPSTKKRMDAAGFINGARLQSGDSFEIS